jgi:hypothetical protein
MIERHIQADFPQDDPYWSDKIPVIKAIRALTGYYDRAKDESYGQMWGLKESKQFSESELPLRVPIHEELPVRQINYVLLLLSELKYTTWHVE